MPVAEDDGEQPEVPRGGVARGVRVVDRELAYLRPYVLALVACYAVGLFFLSRCYVAPTYLIFGLALVFARLCKSEPRLPPTPRRMPPRHENSARNTRE